MNETLLLPTHAQSRYFITHVYLWTSGMVTTYDQYGQQMPEYQGTYEEVVDKINAVYDGVWYWAIGTSAHKTEVNYGKDTNSIFTQS